MTVRRRQTGRLTFTRLHLENWRNSIPMPHAARRSDRERAV